MICRNCGQEFTAKKGSDSKNLCPKCFIQELNHVAATNSGNDPAAKPKIMMDQSTDPKKPEPTTPGTPPATPPGSPTGQEPTPSEPTTPPSGGPTAPAPEGKEPAGEGEGTPAGGGTPPVTPVA